MSGHTPGPWHREAGQLVASMGRNICDVTTGNPADAKLIAAAPELADSLIEVFAVFRNCIGSEAFADFEATNPIIRDARAALAKAGV